MIRRDCLTAENELAELLTQGQLKKNGRGPVFRNLAENGYPVSSARALLVLLAIRGESSDDLYEAWSAIRKAERTALRFNGDCLDTCGTGGDGSHSINLSTLSSIVMAAAGVCVLKHGNRAITSRCGSSDLLNAFGYNLAQKSKKILESARKIKFGYFHAPAVHPVYARFQGLRKSIRIRTLFNLLGPVLNPVAVPYQILGTADPELSQRYQKLLPQLGRRRSLIFTGPEGMDEITSLGLSRGVMIEGRTARPWKMNPAQLGFVRGNKKDLEIYSVADAKKKAVAILKNKKKGTARDSVVLSAAVGIFIAKKNTSLRASVQAAESALDSGKAWSLLQEMVRISNL